MLAGGLGVTLLASGAIAQVQPGADAAAPGTDASASRNQRTVQESQGDQAGQPVATDGEAERVLITGSYIPTAEGEGALPVAVFTQDDLRKFGANSAAEGLRRLPSFVGNAATENDSNGGSGSAGINLRALGQENTLVLINGRRAGNPSLGSGFQDINAIPFGAIDHIEVLKDGASATYGSDAVAGVVNIILRTEYTGSQVDFLYGNTTNNDASTYRADVVSGFQTKDKKLNVVVNANYFRQEAIFSSDRFLSSVANKVRFGGLDTGSPTFGGRLVAGGANLILNGGTSSAIVPTSPADYRPVQPSTADSSDALNFRQFTPAIPKQERYAYYGATDYKVADALDIYAQALYSNNRQYNSLAPSPGAFGAGIVRLSPFDPFVGQVEATEDNPTGTTLGTTRYRLLELGPRRNTFDHRYYHFVGGVKGTFLKNFNYDFAFVHDEDKTVQTLSGDAQYSLLTNEIIAGNFNPFIGVNAPKTGVVNGVPYDNVAAAARSAYITDDIQFNNQNFVEGRLSGTFFPDAPQGGVSLALGGEVRRESFVSSPSFIETSGDTFGFNSSPAFRGTQDVYSVFGEALVPIVSSTMKVPGIYNLSFTVAGRYQKFDFKGIDPLTALGVKPTLETSNPKYELRYQPTQDITLRASYSTSFRSPSLVDLFQSSVAGADFPELTDPLFGTRVQPADGDTVGGNASLKSEDTDAYTGGIVLSPRFVPGLNITIDYYELNQKNVIIPGSSAAQFYVSQNFAGGGARVNGDGSVTVDPTAPFANFVTREAGTGTLLSVAEVPFNAARRSVQGIDITAFYELPTQSFGKFNFTLNFNHFVRYNVQVADGLGFTDFTGTFSSAVLTPGSIPYNKGVGIFEWQYKGFDFITTVNYIGDYSDDNSAVNGSDISVNSTDPANPVYTRDRKVAAYCTLDLQLSYEFKAPEAAVAPVDSKDAKDYKGGKQVAAAPGVGASLFQKILGGTTLTVGCNDVFDTPPPFAAGAFNDNYDTSLYTIRNRFIYGAITKKF